MVPELVYDMFLDVVYVKGIIDITFDRKASWGHVAHVAPGEVPSGGDVAAAAQRDDDADLDVADNDSEPDETDGSATERALGRSDLTKELA